MPVLLDEVMEYLNVRPGGVVADATLGLAGHSSEIARRLGPKGTLIAFDRDPEAMELAKVKLDELAAELGSEMPTLKLVPKAFSEAAKVASGFPTSRPLKTNIGVMSCVRQAAIVALMTDLRPKGVGPRAGTRTSLITLSIPGIEDLGRRFK